MPSYSPGSSRATSAWQPVDLSLCPSWWLVWFTCLVWKLAKSWWKSNNVSAEDAAQLPEVHIQHLFNHSLICFCFLSTQTRLKKRLFAISNEWIERIGLAMKSSICGKWKCGVGFSFPAHFMWNLTNSMKDFSQIFLKGESNKLVSKLSEVVSCLLCPEGWNKTL